MIERVPSWYAVNVKITSELFRSPQDLDLHEEVKDWLLANVGWGDLRWWNRLELEHHFETCHNGVTCREVTGFECYGETDFWGWTPGDEWLSGSYIPVRTMETVTFIFRRSRDATLFKLAWGGL